MRPQPAAGGGIRLHALQRAGTLRERLQAPAVRLERDQRRVRPAEPLLAAQRVSGLEALRQGCGVGPLFGAAAVVACRRSSSRARCPSVRCDQARAPRPSSAIAASSLSESGTLGASAPDPAAADFARVGDFAVGVTALSFGREVSAYGAELSSSRCAPGCQARRSMSVRRRRYRVSVSRLRPMRAAGTTLKLITMPAIAASGWSTLSPAVDET